ncbi:MAG: HNH endonuclease signature motif containing protein, partial [Corynebacterium flavescens]
PWKHGGETNVANLVTLCSYHNGINDDDPNAPPRRGRLTRDGGKIIWQPPHTSR